MIKKNKIKSVKPKSTFTEEFTSKIAKLSKLDLTPAEVEYFTGQFNSTLEVINKLGELDTSKVKEAYNITGLKNIYREDEIDPKRILSQEDALSNAKRTHKGYFVVKGIFDEQ